MKKKAARRRTASKRSSRNDSSVYFRYVVFFALILVVFLGVKKAYKFLQDNNVLGQSVFLAEEGQPPPPPPSGGDSGSGGGQPPPPQDQPQQQAPQQQSGQQPPQYQPAQQYQQGGQPQQYQPNNQQQPQYQGQYPQQSGDQQHQQYQPGSQQNNQSPQQFQGGQQNPQQFSGSGNGPYPSESPEQHQQYLQFQEQYKQEAAKNGFQFSGSLPPQFQQMQNQQAGSGQSGQGQSSNKGEGSANSGQGSRPGPNFQALPGVNQFPSISGRFEIKPQGGTENINLNDPNTRIQLFSQNNTLGIKARNADGTEVPIDKEALEKINAAMKLETGSEVSHSGDQFTFKRAGIEAQTRFPISFNVATKTFSVQTPNGEKVLHVLPDQAVEKLMQNKVFSQVTAGPNQQGGNATGSGVQLTEFQNQPVFEVHGTVQKKLFGLPIPVTIDKTAFVSTDTGEPVNISQNIISKIIEAVSR